MADTTLYERAHMNRQEQAFGICLGRIVEVFPKERLCSVATFSGVGTMNDQFIPKCQWLNIDSNPDGDEFTTIPRRGSFALVFFVEGEPFVFGFFKPPRKGGIAAQGNEASTAIEGDKLFSTAAGNRVTLKASGAIEIESNQTLRRVYFPTGSQMIDICRAYNMQNDGGTLSWGSDAITKMTKFAAEYRRDITGSFVVLEEKGGVDSTTLLRTTIGPAIPGVPGSDTPMYVSSVSLTGEVETEVHTPAPAGTPSGVYMKMRPEGAIDLKVGAAHNLAAKIEPTGALDIDINSITKISASAQGDFSVQNKLTTATIASDGSVTIESPGASISISVAGEVTVKSTNKIALDAKAGVDIKSSGPVAVEALGAPVTIKGQTVQIDGGSGVMESVLTNPSTLSPFTGAPLAPFSTTVKVSI